MEEGRERIPDRYISTDCGNSLVLQSCASITILDGSWDTGIRGAGPLCVAGSYGNYLAGQ